MYEECDVCGKSIRRDYFRSGTGPPPGNEWLGLCACVNRRWRWRSATGGAPWELITPSWNGIASGEKHP